MLKQGTNMTELGIVLIIEDDKLISQNIQTYLFSHGLKSEIVHEGDLAMKKLRENNYIALILDINLPFKNGFEICKEFRSFNSMTPILMLTAFDELEDKMQGFEVGADDYLTKPFYMEEVLARLKSLVNRVNKIEKMNLERILQIHELKINLETGIVSRSNNPISLTAREFNLLVKLAKAKGNIVTKRELNKTIWGGTLDENNNTIEVYINFLRKKIDKPFSIPLIKTKIGFGYYLSENEH